MAKSLVLIFFISSFFAFGFAFAQEGCEPKGERPEETRVSSWQVESVTYQCGNNECGGTVKQKTTEEETVTRTFYTPETDPETHCPIWKANTTSFLSGAKRTDITNTNLDKYQACPESANNAWFSSNPAQCSGICYPKPEVKELRDETLSPKNVFDVLQTPKLPVNVGWKDNVEQQLSLDGGACQVSSYQYKVKQGSSTIVSEQTGGSSHSTVVGGNSCELDPNSSYSFEVRSCAGETCSQPGTLSFSTSNTPQLLYPYDSDWEEKGSGFGDLPTSLAWCPDPSARSFRYKIYKDQVSEQSLVWEDIVPSSTTSYDDSTAQVLKKDVKYFWHVAPCTSSSLTSCGIFSHLWSFIPQGVVLSSPQLRKPFFNPANPEQVPAVNTGDILEWQGDPFTPFFMVLVNVDTGQGPFIKFLENTGGAAKLPFSSFWNYLDLETSYSWKVFACGNNQPESCEAQSEVWDFKTTGEPPTEFTITPKEPGGARIALPATFGWNDVPGAASYVLRLGEQQSLNTIPKVQNSRLVVDYPTIAPNAGFPEAVFFWSVRTCADKASFQCGAWSEFQPFVFAPLQAPAVLEPTSTQTEFFGKSTAFKWTKDFGSNFFTYQLNFLGPSAEEKSPSCQTPRPVAEGFTEQTNTPLRLRCLGQYEFGVNACIDKTCEVAGPQETQQFSVEKFEGKAGGLIPCDANNDNPATIGLDEREPCELKHLFLLVHNLVDFALWKLSLVLLIAMTAFTGFTVYTSFGGMEVTSRVKSIWRAVGIGFLILLFSWFLLNLLLGVVGFQVNVFGKWHEVVL